MVGEAFVAMPVAWPQRRKPKKQKKNGPWSKRAYIPFTGQAPHAPVAPRLSAALFMKPFIRCPTCLFPCLGILALASKFAIGLGPRLLVRPCIVGNRHVAALADRELDKKTRCRCVRRFRATPFSSMPGGYHELSVCPKWCRPVPGVAPGILTTRGRQLRILIFFAVCPRAIQKRPMSRNSLC